MTDLNASEKKLIDCPHCGEQILKKATLCRYCKKSVEIVECPFCAEPILKSCKNCPHCGSLLVKSFGYFFRPLTSFILKHKKVFLSLFFLFLAIPIGFILFEVDNRRTKWSSVHKPLKHKEARAYCESLGERWRLPEMEELISLIKNYPATMPGGSCQSNSGDWLSDINHPCRGSKVTGVYSTLGDTFILFSKQVGYNTASSTAYVYCVNFSVGGFDIRDYEDDESYFRCIRPAKKQKRH